MEPITAVAKTGLNAAQGDHGHGSALTELHFPGGPTVALCIPNNIRSSFLADNQSVSFWVSHADGRVVHLIPAGEELNRFDDALLTVSVFNTVDPWQRVISEFRSKNSSVQIGEFVFKSGDPSANFGRYFAVSTERPVNFFVDLGRGSPASAISRRQQLSSLVDSISGFFNAMECK
jgi:hypothetical protein